MSTRTYKRDSDGQFASTGSATSSRRRYDPTVVASTMAVGKGSAARAASKVAVMEITRRSLLPSGS